MARERETYLVFNPGPPRRKKKIGKKRKNPVTPMYNHDLVSRMEFITASVGSTKLDDIDRFQIRNCLREISDLIVKAKG